MKYAGTYFDYQHLRFKKNVKSFSTDRGDSCFLTLVGVDPNELWSHGRKVHIFFSKDNFFNESTLFYHAYAIYLRTLQEKDILNPERKIYLHFIEDNEETEAFYGYVKSLTEIYFKWGSLKSKLNPKFKFNGKEIVRYVREKRKRPYVFTKYCVPMSGDHWGWTIIPDRKSMTWELAMTQYVDIHEGSKLIKEPLYFFMSENLDSEMMFTKVKKSKREFTPEESFALSTIKLYTDPAVLKDVLGVQEIDSDQLMRFVKRESPYDSLSGREKNIQDAFASAYECFISTYDQLLDASKFIPIIRGDDND